MKPCIILLLICLSAHVSAQPAAFALQEQIYHARDKVLPALVHVEPIKNVYNHGEKQRTLVTGSGVIISEDLYVVTNHHVAGNAEKVWCTLSTKERVTATVIGSDPSTDIAVLKLNTEELLDKNLPYARLGDSSTLQVGQFVLALGSPLGLSRSVSWGTVSSIDRYFPDRGSMISPYNLWLQTDAAINPGNSGGPLINLEGEVVGINARAVFLADNLGFAIPINLVSEVVDEIIAGSSVSRSWIGLKLQEIKDLRDYLNQPDFSGALVSSVTINSPAARAGIKPGDVVTKLETRPINAVYEEDLPAIRKIITELPHDREITAAIWRDGKNIKIKLTAVEEPLKEDEPEFEAGDWGVVVKNLSWQLHRMQMMSDFSGVFITSVKPGGPAELSNLRGGDVLRKMNGVVVKDNEHFRELFENMVRDGANMIYLELLRGGYPYFTVLKIK